MFFSILILVHFLAALIPIILGFKSFNKFEHINNNKIIPFGIIFLGLASVCEMIDHSKTSWIYVDHSSLFNWLFYSFLSLGLTFLSISITKNTIVKTSNLCITICSIISYFLFDKTITLFFQAIISVFLIINWHRIFKDWILILYPIFGTICTTFFGTNLSNSGEQFWHIFNNKLAKSF